MPEKNNYFKRVNEHPLTAMNVFLEFLAEEQQWKNKSSHSE
ncbi:DUF5392 family protein [[Brevibacterium] frigoritolerans]|uniref:DUF5392 family protein n=1 Tax=Peribacillus frigoritolerans TaxID=450367 RepID=A0A941FSU2_9BACI|nr:DUF5392 family protein [Peribacillus frigoritolerans]